MRPTSARLLAGIALGAAVVGWLLRHVSLWAGSMAPRVGWAQVRGLWLAAVVLLVVAALTYRALQQGKGRLEPQQAVNRLVLAKACALVGALALGFYTGYAVTWIGSDSELAGQRIERSGVAAGAAFVMLGASLWLERACRVRDDEPES